MEETFEFALNEKGEYLLDVHYNMEIDGVEFNKKLKEITIEIK